MRVCITVIIVFLQLQGLKGLLHSCIPDSSSWSSLTRQLIFMSRMGSKEETEWGSVALLFLVTLLFIAHEILWRTAASSSLSFIFSSHSLENTITSSRQGTVKKRREGERREIMFFFTIPLKVSLSHYPLRGWIMFDVPVTVLILEVQKRILQDTEESRFCDSSFWSKRQISSINVESYWLYSPHTSPWQDPCLKRLTFSPKLTFPVVRV